MTDAMTTQARLEAELERVAAERDSAREMLREMGRENAKLRAALNLHREALADHRRELKRLSALSEEEGTPDTRPDPRWFPEDDPPINPGWYAVQRKDGSLCLRAFGNGEWWIPLKDGWLSGLPPGFRWMGPLEPVEWDTPRSEGESPSPATPSEDKCPGCGGSGVEQDERSATVCPRCGGSGRATPSEDTDG